MFFSSKPFLFREMAAARFVQRKSFSEVSSAPLEDFESRSRPRRKGLPVNPGSQEARFEILRTRSGSGSGSGKGFRFPGRQRNGRHEMRVAEIGLVVRVDDERSSVRT